MELTKSYPRMHNIFTSLVYGALFMQPKHIWEEVENPHDASFKNVGEIYTMPHIKF
jgi:peptide/nickel transport system substrate-binding protein